MGCWLLQPPPFPATCKRNAAPPPPSVPQDDLLLYYNHQHETRNTRLVDVMQARWRHTRVLRPCRRCGCADEQAWKAARQQPCPSCSLPCTAASAREPSCANTAPDGSSSPCVPQTNLVLTTPETSLADVTKLLDGPPSIEGLPVCDADKKVGEQWEHVVVRHWHGRAWPASRMRPAWHTTAPLSSQLMKGAPPRLLPPQLVGVISKKDLKKGGAAVKVGRADGQQCVAWASQRCHCAA